MGSQKLETDGKTNMLTFLETKAAILTETNMSVNEDNLTSVNLIGRYCFLVFVPRSTIDITVTIDSWRNVVWLHNI